MTAFGRLLRVATVRFAYCRTSVGRFWCLRGIREFPKALRAIMQIWLPTVHWLP